MRRFLLIALAVLLIVWLFTGVSQIRSNERAVVRRFGKIVAQPGPGLWIGFPWGIDRVDRVADASFPGRLVEEELLASPQEFWSLTEQGALAYRAGRFQEAIPLFQQSLRADSAPGRAVGAAGS